MPNRVVFVLLCSFSFLEPVILTFTWCHFKCINKLDMLPKSHLIATEQCQHTTLVLSACLCSLFHSIVKLKDSQKGDFHDSKGSSPQYWFVVTAKRAKISVFVMHSYHLGIWI